MPALLSLIASKVCTSRPSADSFVSAAASSSPASAGTAKASFGTVAGGPPAVVVAPVDVVFVSPPSAVAGKKRSTAVPSPTDLSAGGLWLRTFALSGSVGSGVSLPT